MKRNVSYFLTCLSILVFSSCEKHSWEDTTEVITEVIRDEDGKIIKEIKTPQIVEKGAKRFFTEHHDSSNHGVTVESHGKTSHDKADSHGVKTEKAAH